MNRKKIFLALTMGYFCLLAFSQYGPREISQTFFDTWKHSGLSPACQALIRTNPSRQINDTVQARLEKRLEYLSERKGEYIAGEEVNTDTISASFVKTTWLVKFEKEPLFLVLTFYKPYGQWQYLSFDIDQEHLSTTRSAGNGNRQPVKNRAGEGNKQATQQKGKF